MTELDTLVNSVDLDYFSVSVDRVAQTNHTDYLYSARLESDYSSSEYDTE